MWVIPVDLALCCWFVYGGRAVRLRYESLFGCGFWRCLFGGLVVVFNLTYFCGLVCDLLFGGGFGFPFFVCVCLCLFWFCGFDIYYWFVVLVRF